MIKTGAMAIPEALQEDIRRAVRMLKEEGCSEVFLFGSVVTGRVREGSDIDLAIRGCPSGSFFHLLGRLLLERPRPVDLVNLDAGDAFAQYVLKEGPLVRVG
jgi:predicted nucleotidyltransferase